MYVLNRSVLQWLVCYYIQAVHDICTRLVHLSSRSTGDEAVSHLNGSTCNLIGGARNTLQCDGEDLQKRVRALEVCWPMKG